MSRIEIIQANKQQLELSRIANLRKKIIQKQVNLEKHKYLTYFSLKFFAVILGFLVGGILGFLVLGNRAGIADYVFFVGLFGIIAHAIQSFSERIRDFSREITHVEKLREFFDSIPRSEMHLGKSFILKKGNFVLKNVAFSYDGESDVFEDFSLIIKGGTKIALIGESGSGKTTLVKLLAGYIKPKLGKIMVDEQNLAKIKLANYYENIAYLTQDPLVFDGTIYENLVYALKNEPSVKEIKKVIKMAKCEFIWDFSEGLETEIGERGIRLSGGERQRLAIAKVMLRNPQIIFLDEPTSALDSFNEEQITLALNELFKNKTVIIVAHRLQTVKQADRILFIENGKIIEDGTHKELLQLKGKYKKMLDLQTGF